jgi:hypothetical protein
MFKRVLFVVALLVTVFTIAVDSQAGCYTKEVTFVNRSGQTLYIYDLEGKGWLDIWYCSRLIYDRKLYPGCSVTFYIDQGNAAWFKFQSDFGKCDYWSDYTDYFFETRQNPYDDVVYIW